MDKQALVAEAGRRRILPPDKQAAYDEAVRRGLLPGADKPPEAEDESFSLKSMVANIGPDAWETVKNTVYPVAHPIEFKNGIEALIENPEARHDVWEQLKTQYGDPVRYAEEKPIQALMDLSTLLSGVGLLGKVGTLGKVGEVASKVGKVGEAIHPLSVAGAPLKGVRKAVAKTGFPEKMYESAMKIPPGSVKQSARKDIIDTLIRREKLPLKQSTYGKMSKVIGEVDDGVTAELARLSEQGATVDINRVTSRLEALKKKFINRPDPQPYMDAIDEVVDQFARHSFVKEGRVSLSDAQALKKGTYKELSEFYKRRQKPETGRSGITNDIQAEIEAKAEAASALRQAILDSPDVPSKLKDTMKREAGLMNARKWVERATNRGGNLDVVNLSGMMFGVLTQKGLPGAAAWRIATSQPTLSRLAVTLENGSQTLQKMGAVVKPGTLGSFQAGRLVGFEEEPEE